jgi:integrase
MSHKFMGTKKLIIMKTKNVKISLDCKTNYISKDGKFPLLLRIACNSKQIYINIGKSIEEKFYDKKNKQIKKEVKGSSSYIDYVEKHKVKICEIIADYERNGQVINLQKIRETYLFQLGKIDSVCFYEYVKETIAKEKELNLLKEKTLYNYERNMVILKEYCPSLSIHDIDETFLEKYESYLLNKLHKARNSKFHAMCFIRKYTLKLFKAGKIKNYPFNTFVVGSPELGEPLYLELEELNKLHDLFESGELLKIVRNSKSQFTKYKTFALGEKYQEVLKCYLASCYCGLRHSDIKTLKTSEIKGANIVKIMKKGRKGKRKSVNIPIRKRFESLLQRKSENGFAFGVKVKESSQSNKYLKDIAKIAGIEKELTFHSARHTFAVVSLRLGVPIDVISDILGHSELKTTQRYARVVGSYKNEQMNKWDKISENESNVEVEVNCPNCSWVVMKFDKDSIKIKKLPCKCQSCNEDFVYNLSV